MKSTNETSNNQHDSPCSSIEKDIRQLLDIVRDKLDVSTTNTQPNTKPTENVQIPTDNNVSHIANTDPTHASTSRQSLMYSGNSLPLHLLDYNVTGDTKPDLNLSNASLQLQTPRKVDRFKDKFWDEVLGQPKSKLVNQNKTQSIQAPKPSLQGIVDDNTRSFSRSLSSGALESNVSSKISNNDNLFSMHRPNTFTLKPRKIPHIVGNPTQNKSQTLFTNRSINDISFNTQHSSLPHPLGTHVDIADTDDQMIADTAIKKAETIYENFSKQFIAIHRECRQSIKNRIKKIHNLAKEYLDENGIKMSEKLRQEFLQEFRESIQQIRQKMQSTYRNKIVNKQSQLAHKIDNISSEYQRDLSKFYSKKLNTLKCNILATQGSQLKQLSDQIRADHSSHMNTLRNQLDLENEQSLSNLQTVMHKEFSEKKQKLIDETHTKYLQKCDDFKKELQQQFDKDISQINEMHLKHIDHAKQNIASNFANLVNLHKADCESKFHKETEMFKQQMQHQFESECQYYNDELEQKLSAIKEEHIFSLDHDKSARLMQFEIDYKQKRDKLDAEHAKLLSQQKIDMQQQYSENLHKIESEYLKKFDNDLKLLRLECKQEFDSKNRIMILQLKEEFESKKKDQLSKIETELAQERSIILDKYKNTLQQALNQDISREKKRLKESQWTMMEKIKNDFMDEKKRWLDKLYEAAALDKQQAINHLKKSLEHEKEEAIRDMEQQIQDQKCLQIEKLRIQHENDKRQQLQKIEQMYLIDSKFEQTKNLLQIQDEMAEEINLLSKFEMFAQRIKQLEGELVQLRSKQA